MAITINTPKKNTWMEHDTHSEETTKNPNSRPSDIPNEKPSDMPKHNPNEMPTDTPKHTANPMR